MNFGEKSKAANDFVVSILTEFQLNKSATTYVSGELGVLISFSVLHFA